MSRSLRPRACAGALLLLAALAACQDPTDPRVAMERRAAQGDVATLTVNSPGDPGIGVCDEAECTLREAISAAASGDKIVFAASLQDDILLAGSELSIDKSLTIDGARRIVVDAGGNSRVISVADLSEPVVTLTGLTFKNGSADRGAGIAVGISTLTLDGVRVTHNEATIDGGGISVGLGTVTVLNSTIDSNTAAESGGGIDVSGGGSLTLVNSTLAGNTSDRAGGAYNEGTLTVTASTISGNRSQAFGGGLTNFGTMSVRSSTVTKNSGGGGGAGGVWSQPSGRGASVANSIIVGNIGNNDDNCFGPVVSAGYNLTSSSSLDGCSFAQVGDLKVANDQLFVQVLEQELKDNGGPTKTHALITRGRAADRGYCPGETTDQRGFGRPVDDPAMPNALDACDIGAYELQGPVAIVADLMISQSVNKTSVKQGELLTYSIRVQNLGPETAPNVVVTDIQPTGATFVEARSNKGSHKAPPRGETGTVTWTIGEMLDQANEVALITVTVLVKGKTTITNTASVTGDVSDPNQANNSASIRVSVASGTSKPAGKR